MPGKNIVLASGSPRRRELLAKMGYEFICDKTALRGSDIDDEHVKAVLDTVKTYGIYK